MIARRWGSLPRIESTFASCAASSTKIRLLCGAQVVLCPQVMYVLGTSQTGITVVQHIVHCIRRVRRVNPSLKSSRKDRGLDMQPDVTLDRTTTPPKPGPHHCKDDPLGRIKRKQSDTCVFSQEIGKAELEK